MADGEIPINTGDLPIDGVTLDDSLIYNVSLKKATISPKADKNGVRYCAIQTEVADGDYEGMLLMSNYLPLPVAVAADAPAKARIQAQNSNAAFGRMCRTFGIRATMPTLNFSDSDSLREWHEWMEKFYGNLGKVQIRNQEFPQGSGRLRSGISDFVV